MAVSTTIRDAGFYTILTIISDRGPFQRILGHRHDEQGDLKDDIAAQIAPPTSARPYCKMASGKYLRFFFLSYLVSC